MRSKQADVFFFYNSYLLFFQCAYLLIANLQRSWVQESEWSVNGVFFVQVWTLLYFETSNVCTFFYEDIQMYIWYMMWCPVTCARRKLWFVNGLVQMVQLFTKLKETKCEASWMLEIRKLYACNISFCIVRNLHFQPWS